MPSPQQILDGLTTIANNWRGLAVAWHLLLGAALVAFLRGWRPEKRLLGAVLAAPIACVGALAWLSGNPFNGSVFGILVIVLVAMGRRLSRSPVRPGGRWTSLAGVLLLFFAWIYPHFLHTSSWMAYLYASPLGLVPCPTLSAIVGIALILDGLGSRGWSLIVSVAGILYGLIGWSRLGVRIDVVLLAGALILGVVAMRHHSSKTEPSYSTEDGRGFLPGGIRGRTNRSCRE